MRTTLAPDDELFAKAQALTGLLENSGLDLASKLLFQLENHDAIRSLPRWNAPDIRLAAVVNDEASTPEGPQKSAAIRSQPANRLLAMDRYEQSIKRRNVAISAFDEARRRQTN